MKTFDSYPIVSLLLSPLSLTNNFRPNQNSIHYRPRVLRRPSNSCLPVRRPLLYLNQINHPHRPHKPLSAHLYLPDPAMARTPRQPRHFRCPHPHKSSAGLPTHPLTLLNPLLPCPSRNLPSLQSHKDSFKLYHRSIPRISYLCRRLRSPNRWLLACAKAMPFRRSANPRLRACGHHTHKYSTWYTLPCPRITLFIARSCRYIRRRRFYSPGRGGAESESGRRSTWTCRAGVLVAGYGGSREGGGYF